MESGGFLLFFTHVVGTSRVVGTQKWGLAYPDLKCTENQFLSFVPTMLYIYFWPNAVVTPSRQGWSINVGTKRSMYMANVYIQSPLCLKGPMTYDADPTRHVCYPHWLGKIPTGLGRCFGLLCSPHKVYIQSPQCRKDTMAHGAVPTMYKYSCHTVGKTLQPMMQSSQ